MVPPRARERHEEYALCVTCGRVYWKGTHYERMRRLVDAVVSHTDTTDDPMTQP